jgi:aspartate aminotransferase
MKSSLGRRTLQVKSSPTLAIAAQAAAMMAQGLDIVGLATGEPDFDTPIHIKTAAIEAINNGFTKYTAVDGIPELKQAVKDKFVRDNQLSFELNQIIISVGGKQSIYNLCQALLNKGDEAIIPAPYWVSYPDIVLLAEGKPIILPTTAAQSYKITPQQLEDAITPRTKMFFINSPSNPSGIAYSLAELKALAAVLKKYPHIYIATDDMYEHTLWSKPFVNILNACPELYSRTIILNGVSKAYAMTGWRIGFAAGPVEIIGAMKTVQSQSTSNPCSIAQKAAVAALNGDQTIIAKMVDAFHSRHDYLIERFSAIPGVEVSPADGTFYLFPNIQKIIEQQEYKDDLDFSQKLLKAQGVALVPGSAFGTEGCIRLSFATSMENLQKAMDRLEKFIKNAE